MQSSPSKHANQDFSMDSVDDFLFEKAFKSNVVVGFHDSWWKILAFLVRAELIEGKKTTTHIPDLFFYGFPSQVDDLRSQLTTDLNWLAYETAINCHLFSYIMTNHTRYYKIIQIVITHHYTILVDSVLWFLIHLAWKLLLVPCRRPWMSWPPGNSRCLLLLSNFGFGSAIIAIRSGHGDRLVVVFSHW